jgi:hypothetical protein
MNGPPLVSTVDGEELERNEGEQPMAHIENALLTPQAEMPENQPNASHPWRKTYPTTIDTSTPIFRDHS